MWFKERRRLHNVKVQDEAVTVHVEAAACCPEDLDKVIVKVAAINNRFQCRQNSHLLEEDFNLGLS